MLDRFLHNVHKIFDLNDPYTLEVKITFFFLALIMWFLILIVVNTTVRVEKYRPDLKKVECDDIRNRIVSIIHGVYSLFITVYHIYQHNPQYGATISNFQHVIVFTSWAYFIYDMLACVYYRLTSVGLYVHHFLCIFGYLMDELYDRSATDTLMGLFYAEVSNSPMHLRVIVRTLGLKHTKLYELFEFLYFGSYILARGVGIPFVVYGCVTSVRTPIIVKGVCLGLFVQSSIYIREMILIGKRRFGYYRERVKKGVSLFWLVENPKVKDLSYYGREKKEIIF